jgi:hypothetical protein
VSGSGPQKISKLVQDRGAAACGRQACIAAAVITPDESEHDPGRPLGGEASNVTLAGW